MTYDVNLSKFNSPRESFKKKRAQPVSKKQLKNASILKELESILVDAAAVTDVA